MGIAEAIAAESDETLGTSEEPDETGTDVVSEDDDTVVEEDDDTVVEEDDDIEEDDDDEVDDWDTDPSEDEDEEDDEDDEQKLVAQEAEEEEGSNVDPLENLTAEEIAAINANPALKKLKRAIMRGYNERVKQDAELLQLGAAYKSDPVGTVQTLARAHGMSIQEATEMAQAGAAAADQQQGSAGNAMEQAGKELEALFGEKIGPRVRSVFERWADARFGDALQPVEQVVGQLTSTQEAQRMMSEEQSFKERHKDILTPELERKVIELGSSGMIVPGEKMTPAEYLDTLLDVAIARNVKSEGANAGRNAARRLAKKVRRNRSDQEPSGVSSKARMSKKSRVSEAGSISEALDIADAELSAESL